MPTVAIVAGVAAAGSSVASSAIQAHSAKSAANTQATAAKEAQTQTRADTDKALQYIMGQQAAVRSPMQTSPAYARMYQGLGLGNQFNAQYGPSSPGANRSPIAQDGLVQLQAPDGTRKGVPAAQVDHFVSLGAKRV